MQEPGRRRTAPPFAGVDLRHPKDYPASTPAKAEAPVSVPAEAGDPCPRCESRDTKFCYYNNYNTSQPRHFCKSCRRYWTKGGSLRNVPVGGGTRKSSSSAAVAAPPKNPKRSKNSKRRRVAPDPESAPSTDASTAAPADEAPTEAATEGAADDPDARPAADGGFTDPSVALGLGLTDAGEEPSDPSPFEWPSGCDLGSYWATGVFADTDASLFLNLP